MPTKIPARVQKRIAQRLKKYQAAVVADGEDARRARPQSAAMEVPRDI